LARLEQALDTLSRAPLPERGDECRDSLKHLDSIRLQLSCLPVDAAAPPKLHSRIRRAELRCRVLRVKLRCHLARRRFVEALLDVRQFDDLEPAVKEFEESLHDIAGEAEDIDFVRESLLRDAAAAASILRRERRRIRRYRRKALELLETERADFRKREAVSDIKAARGIYEREVREWWADATDLVDALVLVERVERSDVPDALRTRAVKLKYLIHQRIWTFIPAEKHAWQFRIRLKDYTRFKDYPNWNADRAAERLWVEHFRESITPEPLAPGGSPENSAPGFEPSPTPWVRNARQSAASLAVK
jgi:hypothetical protein